ncbi:MAG: tetratricopeptide repeat protein [Alphaproteobacteria bacterium]|nr:tetratricopeptide repeat protein [Alphaproteobacteria bacterium]
MAVKPRDDDAFLREVDEELRRDQLSSIFTRYGWWIIGGALLLLAAVGVAIWWNHRQDAKAGEASQRLVQVIEQLDANNARGASAGIDELAASDRAAYRYSALFLRANAQIQTNAIPAAIATLASIAADENAPQAYRDAALIRQTQLEYDQLQPAQVVQRLQGYAQAGNPWLGTAGEMVAVALIRQQRAPQAAQILSAMARDPAVPESIKSRAIQMASALGVDAVQLDPSIEQAIQAGGGAGTPGAAAPGAATPGASAQGATTQGNDVAARDASQ